MLSTEVHIAKLEPAELERLRQLEDRLGSCLVAVDRPPEFADLSPQELAELKAAEQAFGRVLLAYKRGN